MKYKLARRLGGRPAQALERLVAGDRKREQVLVRLLGMHYASRFRRQWLWSAELPHFFEHRLDGFRIVFGDNDEGIYVWFRGFFVAEIVRERDVLLDIGCGDGFFTARFYGSRCLAVDGIDVDPDAIATAERDNPAQNVRYHLRDAVGEPFPRERYDVVVWDGAIGHFAPGVTRAMLEKIAAALEPGGIFCGSESLGIEGHDHLQFFPDLEALRDVLAPVFPRVSLREVTYTVKRRTRREAFWRCELDGTRVRDASWTALPAAP